jgi:hypothetical protein
MNDAADLLISQPFRRVAQGGEEQVSWDGLHEDFNRLASGGLGRANRRFPCP